MDEEKTAEYYADPENRRVAGPPRRRKVAEQLTNHVSVRFAPALMGWVRLLAARDGVTPGSWIRSTVEREVERRVPPARTVGGTYELKESLREPTRPSETGNQRSEVSNAFERIAG